MRTDLLGAASAIIILSLGVLMGIFMQNDLFGDYIDSLAALAFLAPFALIVSVVAAISWSRGSGVRRLLRLAIILAWSLVLAVVAFLRTGGFINSSKIDAVNHYVMRAVPILDRIKAKSGSYPQDLPVSILGEPPTLLRDFGSYTSDGKSFRFEYIDEPAEWAGGEGMLEFDSTDRNWKVER